MAEKNYTESASSLGTYRYGFNGKEKDTDGEWGNLTHYDYGFRIYNPGIGKFLSVDPLKKSYAMLTPYQFASNTPIASIDIDGLEAQWWTDWIFNSVIPAIEKKHAEGVRMVTLMENATVNPLTPLQKTGFYIYPYMDDIEEQTGAKQVRTLMNDDASTASKAMAFVLLVVEITPVDEVFDGIKIFRLKKLKKARKGPLSRKKYPNINGTAEDWASKGAHFKDKNGVEFKLRSTDDGNIIVESVFSKTTEAEFAPAAKQAAEALSDPKYREQLSEKLTNNIDYHEGLDVGVRESKVEELIQLRDAINNIE